jgi:hypothetical protein
MRRHGVGLFVLLGRAQRTRMRCIALLVALALLSPAVFSGFAADDYILLYELDHRSHSEWAGRAPFDLFRWIDPAHALRLRDGAGLPWWTYEGSVFACLRPITSALHTLDQTLAPNNALWAHAHNVLWFAVLVTLCWRAYRQLIDVAWVAALASVMFALDAAHGASVGWIANRNALIGASFAITSLLCHHARRRGGAIAWALGAWACLTLSLLSSELAVGILGYLLAYELFVSHDRVGTRVRHLVPYGLILAAWAWARAAGGYGAYRLFTYVDPLREPWTFLRTLPERMAVLMASQSTRLTADLAETVPAALRPVCLGAAGLACAVTVWFVWPSLRAHRVTRFFGLGALLSAVPMAGTLPSDRLMTLIGFGALPVLAHAMYMALQRDTVGSASRRVSLRTGWAAVLSVLHLLVSPLSLPVTALLPAFLDRTLHAVEMSLPASATLGDKTAVITGVPDTIVMSYLPVMLAEHGATRPRRTYWFVSTKQHVQLQRRAANVMRVIPEHGFYDEPSEVRSPHEPLHVGDHVVLSDMTVEVVKLTPDGRPAVCDFVFHESLDSSKYVWLTWRHDHLEGWPVPGIGQSAVVSMS